MGGVVNGTVSELASEEGLFRSRLRYKYTPAEVRMTSREQVL